MYPIAECPWEKDIKNVQPPEAQIPAAVRAKKMAGRLYGQHSGDKSYNFSFKYRPVYESGQATIASGVPAATRFPPAFPPSGPKSIT